MVQHCLNKLCHFSTISLIVLGVASFRLFTAGKYKFLRLSFQFSLRYRFATASLNCIIKQSENEPLGIEGCYIVAFCCIVEVFIQ